MARVYVFVLCVSMAIAQRSANTSKNSSTGNSSDLSELERQNRITQQIFANFLERRLFPHRRPQQKVPTIDDILPTTTVSPRRFVPKSTRRSMRQHKRQQHHEDIATVKEATNSSLDEFEDKDAEAESLQSVESKQHDQYYPDEFADPAENEVVQEILNVESRTSCPTQCTEIYASTIVSCGWDRTVKVWNLANCKLKNNHHGHGHSGYLNTVTVSPDGSLCTSGGKDAKALLWDLNDGKNLYTLEHNDIINALCFSPNRYWLGVAYGPSIKIWDLACKKTVEELRPEVVSTTPKADHPQCLSLAWSTDGQTLFAGYSDNTIRVWQVSISAR